MTPGPRVSVVVPTYQRADHLAGLLADLERVAATGDVEVVIVDDGSQDRTPEVLAPATWATVVRQDNAGAAAARNAGWLRATAPLVAFVDDDCRLGDGWPHDLLAAFDDPEVVGVGGPVEPMGATALDAFVAVERLVDHGRDLPDTVDYLITANAAYRRAALEAVGGFDDAFPGAAGEDVDLSWRLRAAGGRLVRGTAPVRHDHRTSVAAVLRTYRGHGRARALLDARHPGRPAGGDVGRALSPATWWERRRGYRARGVGPVAATALLALRAAGLASFWWGLREGRRLPAAP